MNRVSAMLRLPESRPAAAIRREANIRSRSFSGSIKELFGANVTGISNVDVIVFEITVYPIRLNGSVKVSVFSKNYPKKAGDSRSLQSDM